uniref:YTH domain-containing protein n=1 Tax=Syphacia muris TaxID=451379 RepID=A0A0N5ATY6_9BILA
MSMAEGTCGTCIELPILKAAANISPKQDRNDVANTLSNSKLDSDVEVTLDDVASDDHADEMEDMVANSIDWKSSSSKSHIGKSSSSATENDIAMDSEVAMELDTDDLVVQDEFCGENGADGARRIRSKSENYSARSVCKTSLEKLRHVSASPLKYSPSTPLTCGESVEIQAIMHKAQFFLARSCKENIWIAKEKSLWTTTRTIEKLIGEAFHNASAVILIFLARNANHFSGFAKVCSAALYRGQPAVRWKDFNGGGNIKISWISKCSLDLKATKDIKNSFNKEREVYAGQDGCEIQRVAGQRLCSLFPFDKTINLSTLRKRDGEKSHRKRFRSPNRRKSFHSSDRILPSLLENRVSYTQFKRAKRDLSFEELYEKIRRDELRYFFGSSRTFKNVSRRPLFTELDGGLKNLFLKGLRPLFYDSLPVPRSESFNYRQHERSPLPSLLDGVQRCLPHSVFHRPVRLLDEIRDNDNHKRYGTFVKRGALSRQSGHGRDYEAPGSSRNFRSDGNPKYLREENLLRKSERREVKSGAGRSVVKNSKRERLPNSDCTLRSKKRGL